jgi:hypothetical protein
MDEIAKWEKPAHLGASEGEKAADGMGMGEGAGVSQAGQHRDFEEVKILAPYAWISLVASLRAEHVSVAFSRQRS